MRSGTSSNDWKVVTAASIFAFAFVGNLQSLTLASAAITNLFGDVNLVTTAFTLASLLSASLQVLGGKLGMINGLKKMILIGVTIFIVGNIISALSFNATMFLIGWSIINPLGLMLVLPGTASLLTVTYEGAKRGAAFGIYAASIGLSAALGPLVMGTLATFLDWRIMFAYNIALVIIGILIMLGIKETEKISSSIDWIGTILIALSFSSIIISLSSISENLIYVALLSFGFLLLGVFGWWSNRLDKGGREPLFRVRMFKNRLFAVPLFYYSLFIVAVVGFTVLIPQYLQLVLEFSSFESAVFLLAYTLPVFFVSFATGRLSERFEPKLFVILGSLFSVVGLSVFFLMFEVLPLLLSMGFLALVGSGAGLLLPQVQNLILSSVDASQVGEASGLFNSTADLSGSIGGAMIAILAITAGYVFLGVTLIALIVALFIPRRKK